MCRRIQVELAQPVFVDANIFQGHMQANATEYCVQYIYTLYIYIYNIHVHGERERGQLQQVRRQVQLLQ